MNMRERLARAIDPEAMAPIEPEDDYPKERSRRAIARAKALADADAVLDELMTPTEGMLKQSFAAMNDTPSGEWKRLKSAGLTERQMFDAKMRPRYTAMIKAAKEGK